MSRKLLGYRVRAERNGSIVYATGGEAYLWHETPGRPEPREECRQSKRIALYMNRENPATNVKIVAVYLRIETCADCEEYKRTNACAILAHRRLDDLGIPNHEQTMQGGSKVLRLHDRVALLVQQFQDRIIDLEKGHDNVKAFDELADRAIHPDKPEE